jgi:microcystin-dependent protein
MADPFIGNVVLVGFNFAPVGWMPCDGRLLAISTNMALFSLLGTLYGGNGTTNFALPDLRGRVPVGGTGHGPGLANIPFGQAGGTESVTVSTTEMPTHNHPLNVQSGTGSTGVPGNGVVLAQTVVDDGTPISGYSSAAPNTLLDLASVGYTGGGTPVAIRNPYVGLQYIIAVQGIFPSRN